MFLRPFHSPYSKSSDSRLLETRAGYKTLLFFPPLGFPPHQSLTVQVDHNHGFIADYNLTVGHIHTNDRNDIIIIIIIILYE